MAGTYKRKDFETIKLSPVREISDKQDLDSTSFIMEQLELESTPKDKFNIIYMIMVLHGIGTLMPWNMFITAKNYFENYKFSSDYTNATTSYARWYVDSVSFSAQVPSVIFNWINIFLPLAGDMTKRIVWGISFQILIFLETVVMAIMDTSQWPGVFFWITMLSVVVLNTFNGIYQNSVYGMAAKLPGKYTGAVILGANISGTFTAVIDYLSLRLAPSLKTAAIYYFLTALFVLIACLGTYFTLPMNKFYRCHEAIYQQQEKHKQLKTKSNQRTPYWKIFKQCSPQLFNIFFVFFVTLSVFPAVQSSITQSDPNFVVSKKYYMSIMCFVTFNVTAMVGSSIASRVQWPKQQWLVVPVSLRALFIPLFLLCNYVPAKEFTRTMPVWIGNDWVYFVIAVLMGVSSGYLSSLGMMYCPSMVDPRHASTAGMFAAALLITGVFSGVLFAMAMPYIVSMSIWA